MGKAKENAHRRRRYQGAIVSYVPPVYEPLGSYYDDDDDEDEDPTYEDDEIVEILPRRVLRR
ncbi:hypothetical protein BDR05DRAFT_899897 [Suillus weaverae]|nr:hypothetical protein BDR05DRAFT_899897 [Suillus weaverae]